MYLKEMQRTIRQQPLTTTWEREILRKKKKRREILKASARVQIFNVTESRRQQFWKWRFRRYTQVYRHTARTIPE